MKQENENLTILSLDTSSHSCSIAISRGKLILSEYNFITGDKLSSILIPAIDFVLKSVKLSIEDMKLFGIGSGPGLFTGIRIGLSTLKGLLVGKETPVVPVVTLEAIAYKYQKPGSLTIALMDAKRNQVYMAGYMSEENEKKVVIPPNLIEIRDLPLKLKDYVDYHFIGDGVEAYRDHLKKEFPGSKRIQRSSFLASEICKIAHENYLKKQYTTNLQELKPFYLRKPDAEAKPQYHENQNPKGHAR
jgi:tRNA threonylcarbamoyladenosine biosynthesis protein TsaB